MLAVYRVIASDRRSAAVAAADDHPALPRRHDAVHAARVRAAPRTSAPASLFVFRTFDRVSFGVLLNTTDTVRPGDTPHAVVVPSSDAARRRRRAYWANAFRRYRRRGPRSRCAALPPSAVFELLRAFGAPAAVLGATSAQLRSVVPDVIATRLASRADEDLARAHARVARCAGPSTSSPGTTTITRRSLLALGHSPPVLYYVGRLDLLDAPAFAIVGSRSATRTGTGQRACVRARAVRRGARHRVGARARHRRRRARRRARGPCVHACGRRHRARPRVPRAPSRTRACHRGARRPPVRVSAWHAAARVQLPAPQSTDQRTVAGRAGGRGGAPVRLAHHGALCRRAGPRGLRDPRLDPFTAVEGLPQADPRRREARRDRPGRPGGAGLLAAAALQSTPDAPMSEGAVLDALGDDPADVDTLVARTGLAADERDRAS